MNGTYYQNPTFPSAINLEDQTEVPEIINDREPKILEDEHKNEGIFSLNDYINKNVIIYVSFTNSFTMRDKTFEGILKYISDDFIVIRGDDNNLYVILKSFVNYLTVIE